MCSNPREVRRIKVTMPDERTRALWQTKEFLRELMSSEATPGVPEDIRRQARRLSRHYPGNSLLELLHLALPRHFGEVRVEPPMTFGEYIMSDPYIMGGMIVFTGSRVPITTVIGSLDSGNSWERIVESWPFLTEEHISAAREYLRLHPGTR
jgi:uncharacterized protein (DUF433 family)